MSADHADLVADLRRLVTSQRERGGAWVVPTLLAEIEALLPALPEPVKVGDRVRASNGTSGEVLGGPWADRQGADAEEVAVRWDDGMGLELMPVTDLALIPAEPEPEWRECDDPAELAVTVRNGYRVEVSDRSGWRPTLNTSVANFRNGIDLGACYRIGPKVKR